jgi:hypothetical protein
VQRLIALAPIGIQPLTKVGVGVLAPDLLAILRGGEPAGYRLSPAGRLR